MAAIGARTGSGVPHRWAIKLLVMAPLVLLFPGGGPGDPSPDPAAGFADNRCWEVRAAERGFVRKLNRARTSRGRVRVSLDPEASKAARRHTREMVTNDLLYHTPAGALKRRVTRWSTLGENVGVGGTVSSLHAAFMNSPAHRDNVLYPPFRHVGIGARRANGRLWVTFIFEAHSDPGTSLRMPRCRR